KILLQNSIDLYNSGAKVINYQGISSCCTQFDSKVKQKKTTYWRWQKRRSPPPHSPTINLC
ncbi:hypothetical protein, partial [Chlorogloeopsis fritschii]